MEPVHTVAISLASAFALVVGVAAQTIQITGAGATVPYPTSSRR